MKRTLFFLSGVLCALFTACDDNAGKDNPEKTTVTVSEITNLTPGFIGEVHGVVAGDELEKGSTLTLVLTPGSTLMSGFSASHMEHIHIHVGDRIYVPQFPDTEDEYVQTLPVEINIPNTESVAIVVAYAVQQQMTPDGFTMRLEDNEDGVKLYGVDPDRKYKYFDCYLRTPDAYTIESVEFKVGDGEWQDFNSVTGCSFGRSENLDWVYEVSIRPDYQNVTGDVVLRVKGSQHARYKITWKNTEYIKTDIPEDWEQNNLPEESIDGETVVATFYTKDGYYLSGATSNVEGLEIECIARAHVKFTMPASDVEVNLDFKEKIPVSYKESAHITSAQIYDAKDIYYGVPTDRGIPGEAVYLFVNVESGYKPSVAKNDAGESFPFVLYGDGIDKYAYYAEVLLPKDAKSAEITAEVVKCFTVSGDKEIYFNKGTYWAEGEEVSFQVAVPTGKTIDAVSVCQIDGTRVECTMDNAYGKFTMPASDVYVSVSFKDVASGTVAHVSAVYDEDEYRVFCQTNPYYQQIGEEGFDVPVGTTLYINITDDYGNPFWVGVKIGDTISYYESVTDPDMGDVSFGKSFVVSADMVIKVAPNKDNIKF